MISDPKMPVNAYSTFAIRVPNTHFRKATCEEVSCPEFLYGWKLRWDVLSEQDRYLVTHCGRQYKIDQEWIIFPPGQPCFRESKHQTRLDRPELFLKKNVHMGTPAAQAGGVIIHNNAADWTDDFMNTTQKAVDQIERG